MPAQSEESRPTPEKFGVAHPDHEAFWSGEESPPSRRPLPPPPATFKRRWSKRSLGLGLLAIAYIQVAVGFIATGGSSGLLEYGYRWAREAGAPADQIVGAVFIVSAVGMLVCAVGRRWKEQLAGLGFGLAALPVTLHMAVCFYGMVLGDLDVLQYQAALGSQIGIIFILILLHDWPDPSPAAEPVDPPKETQP